MAGIKCWIIKDILNNICESLDVRETFQEGSTKLFLNQWKFFQQNNKPIYSINKDISSIICIEKCTETIFLLPQKKVYWDNIFATFKPPPPYKN